MRRDTANALDGPGDGDGGCSLTLRDVLGDLRTPEGDLRGPALQAGHPRGSQTGAVTNVPPSLAIQQCLPHQRCPARRPRPQGQRTATGLSPLAQVGQPALHGGWRDPDAVVGNLDLDRAVTDDLDTGTGRLGMSDDIG